MRITWYVIDERSGQIVNAVESSRSPENLMEVLGYDFPFRLDDDPPMALLRDYQYWNERP